MSDKIDSLRDQKNSVLRYDIQYENGTYTLYGWNGPLIPLGLRAPSELHLLPSRALDIVLSQTPHHEAMWAGAIGIAATQFAARAWEVEGDAPRLKERTQQLLLNADGGAGWTTFTLKLVQDYLCTNNGCFIEIERYGRGPGARIKALHHLDSLRVRRTGLRDTPVAYEADDGEHLINWYNIIGLSDMPSARKQALGAGQCAAFRAYRDIAKLAAIESFLYEKVTGSRPLEIHVVSGLSNQQLQDAVQSGKEDAQRRGHAAYMGVLIMSTLAADAEVSGYRIPLAEVPNGFDRKQELDISLLAYANNIGLDPQDLQPLTGQQLGAGAQSQVLQDKARGRGMRAFEQMLTHALNTLALPASVSIGFVERSLSDQKTEADTAKTHVDIAATLVDKVGVSADEAKQYLVDYDVLPKSALPNGDQTPGAISDTDKPTAEDGQMPDELPADLGVATKDATDDLLADELAAAQRLAKLARRQA